MTTPQAPPDRPLVTHQLSRQAFEELCSGAVTENFVTSVYEAQRSKRKLLLRAIVEVCGDRPGAVGPLTAVESVWAALIEAEDRDPGVVDDILAYPTVGVWAARTLRRIHDRERDSLPLWSEVGYLHSLVAAAAIRTGTRCDMRLPVVHGVVTLPTVGQVELPMSFPAGFVVLRNRADGAHIGTNRASESVTLDEANPHFFPVQRHTSHSRGLRLDVEINDSDPYREFASPVPPRRMDPTRVAEWRKMLDEAFDILSLWHYDYARELASGLRVVTPLSPGASVKGASSSVAIGCVGAVDRDSATDLAETLVHEFQHSKLNGLFSLIDVGERDNMYAPWRDDPRPLTGLLHGVFAFLSVAEFWRVQRDLVPQQESAAAHYTFALRRRQVADALTSLRDHPALNQIGRLLVDSVRARIRPLALQPITPELDAVIATTTADHRATWRITHARPDPDDIARLATAWTTGSPIPAIANSQVTSRTQEPNHATRRELLHLKAVDTGTFDAAIRHSTLPPGDSAFATGDYDAAAIAYSARVRNAPDDRTSWIGLGLCLRATGNPAAAGILTAPEVTLALYTRILLLTGSAPEPVDVADWLKGVAVGVE